MTRKITRGSKTRKAVSFLLSSPREIGAAEFKAHCLEIMDEVERTRGEVIITKHRKPIARMVPFESTTIGFCGSLVGSVLYENDLVSPIDVQWQADESNLT